MFGGGKRGRGREETVFLIFECGLHKQASETVQMHDKIQETCITLYKSF
jgi:hypothetical protein